LIKVAVVGAAGRMGREVLRAMVPEHGFEVVAAVDRTEIGSSIRDLAGPTVADLVITERLGKALDASPADVTIDFSHHSVVLSNAESAAKRGTSFVIGCTGIDKRTLAELELICQDQGVSGMYVPNFAVGAVLMMRFAELAARWMPDAEIIEYHHDRKEDAPSGTALLTAEKIGKARVDAPTALPRQLIKVEGARGGNSHGIPVLSVRLPGFLAHQDVIFGSKGETLTIRHDSLDRVGFMHGVRLCATHVRSFGGFKVGLDTILFA
jgi:4-hydroxy-tetrahydrodipicolinate reductase